MRPVSALIGRLRPAPRHAGARCWIVSGVPTVGKNVFIDSPFAAALTGIRRGPGIAYRDVARFHPIDLDSGEPSPPAPFYLHWSIGPPERTRMEADVDRYAPGLPPLAGVIVLVVPRSTLERRMAARRERSGRGQVVRPLPKLVSLHAHWLDIWRTRGAPVRVIDASAPEYRPVEAHAVEGVLARSP